MEALQVDISIARGASVPATMEAARRAPITINRDWCKACDICSALCPRCVIEPDWERKPVLVHPEGCTQCGVCWTHCPDFAITSNSR